MHRIDTPTAQKDKFGQGKNGFTRGNPQTGTLATQMDSLYFDAIQEEIANVIELAGIALNKEEHNQLTRAIQLYVKTANDNANSAHQRITAVHNIVIGITDKFQYDNFESRVYSPDKSMHYVIRDDGIGGIYSSKAKSFLWSINELGELNGKIEAKNVIGLKELIPPAIKLNSATNSESQTEAATPLAVKTANDNANSAHQRITAVHNIVIGITDKFQYDNFESRVYSPDKSMHYVIRDDGIGGIYSSKAKSFLWSINELGELNGKIEAKNVIGLSDSVRNMFSHNYNDSAGFVKLPNGLILQWGIVDYYSANGAKGTLQSFYMSFPSKCLSITVSDYGDGANSVSANPVTPGQFVCWAKTLNNRYETSKLHYIAIGI